MLSSRSITKSFRAGVIARSFCSWRASGCGPATWRNSASKTSSGRRARCGSRQVALRGATAASARRRGCDRRLLRVPPFDLPETVSFVWHFFSYNQKSGVLLAVPDLRQWVRPPSATRRFLLRRQPRIILDAVAGCPAEAGLGASNAGIFAMSVNQWSGM